MKINNHIVLDFNKTKQVNTQTIQCDMKSRFVRVSLRHNNSPIDLSDVRVCIMAVKPDGKEIFNDCTVIDAQNGIAEFEITKQMGIVVGEVECQIKLFGKEKLLSSNIFNLSVSKSLSPNSRDSKDQLNTLVNTLGEVQDIDNRFNKTNYKIDENYQKVNAQLSNMIGTKRDINVKLTKDDMDISSDSVRLGLQNLNDEIHELFRGVGSVNAEILPNSITTELLADGCVTNEKNGDNGLFLNQNTIYPLVNIIESELNQSVHKNPIKKGILDIKILNANMDYDYKLCYIAKNNATFGDLIIINAMNKNGTVAYDLFPTVKTTYPNNGVQTHYLTARSPYKEKVIITLNYDHLAEINDFQTHNGYPSFQNRLSSKHHQQIIYIVLFVRLRRQSLCFPYYESHPYIFVHYHHHC